MRYVRDTHTDLILTTAIFQPMNKVNVCKLRKLEFLGVAVDSHGALGFW